MPPGHVHVARHRSWGSASPVLGYKLQGATRGGLRSQCEARGAGAPHPPPQQSREERGSGPASRACLTAPVKPFLFSTPS